MSNYKVIEAVKTDEGLQRLRITGDDTLVFVANMGEDSVSIIGFINFSKLNKS